MLHEIAWALLWIWIGSSVGYLVGVWANERHHESEEEERRQQEIGGF